MYQVKRFLRLPAAAALALLVACASTSSVSNSGLTLSQQPLLGKVVWNDLVTVDLAASKRFYAGLFGWTFDSTLAGSANGYVLARSEGRVVAGLLGVAAPASGEKISRWLPYFSVADVDAAVLQARTGGVQNVVGPADVSLGRAAAVQDAEGAVFGLARSRIGDPDDDSTRPAVGRVVWTELLSNDPARSADFYAATVGLQARTITRRGGTYTLLASGGVDRAGILRNPQAEWSPVWLTHFGVADVDAATARVEQLGGKVLLRPSPQLREGSMAVVADPAGAVLVLQKFPQ